jgi:hypothetical protein
LWLIEGAATLFGNSGSYPSGAALRERTSSVDIGRLLRQGPGAPGGPTLFYAVSRDFVAWLQDRTGAAALRAFVAEYVANPSAWEAAFAAYFGAPFDTALAAFARHRSSAPRASFVPTRTASARPIDGVIPEQRHAGRQLCWQLKRCAGREMDRNAPEPARFIRASGAIEIFRIGT